MILLVAWHSEGGPYGAIPPKLPAAPGRGLLKGKSALAIRLCGGLIMKQHAALALSDSNAKISSSADPLCDKNSLIPQKKLSRETALNLQYIFGCTQVQDADIPFYKIIRALWGQSIPNPVIKRIPY